uniref:Uncharacterized protein n=1 Tax=Populus trichocarpa TaxID=3694 RepID=B9HML3_POPTR
MDRGTVWATNSGEVEKYGTRLREASPDRISQDVDNHWPFISLLVKPENTARAVSAGNLVKISEAIQTTYLKLVLVNQNRFSVLEALVRPRISRFIAGTPAGNSSNTDGHHVRAPVGNSSYTAGQHLMTRSQISRSVYSQS